MEKIRKHQEQLKTTKNKLGKIQEKPSRTKKNIRKTDTKFRNTQNTLGKLGKTRKH